MIKLNSAPAVLTLDRPRHRLMITEPGPEAFVNVQGSNFTAFSGVPGGNGSVEVVDT